MFVWRRLGVIRNEVIFVFKMEEIDHECHRYANWKITPQKVQEAVERIIAVRAQKIIIFGLA